MDKQQTIAFIQSQIQSGMVSKEEIRALLSEPKEQYNSRNLTKIFYIIGALIVLIGVIILVVQNWQEIGFVGRIFVTIGISLATYVSALLFRGDEHRMISQIMFFISAILAPLGAFILLDEANVELTINTFIVVPLILMVIYGVAYAISKRNLLILITIAFGTWTYFALLAKLFERNFDETLIKWAVMLLGVSYMAIAYGLYRAPKEGELESGEEKKSVSQVLHTLGVLAILSAGISMGGFFNVIFIAFIFGAFYASVFLKNRMILALAAIFLIAHVIKLTSEYFVDSIGWPVALVGCGFLVIGVGYASLYVNRKYIKR